MVPCILTLNPQLNWLSIVHLAISLVLLLFLISLCMPLYLILLEFLLSGLSCDHILIILVVSWISFVEQMCQVWFTLGWKSTRWTWRWADLWNDLGFSLCAALSIYHVVTILDDGEKSEMGVSAKWCVTIEHWRSSSIRGYLCWLSD